jgi:steroid 5-alpha reductase family enzyme
MITFILKSNTVKIPGKGEDIMHINIRQRILSFIIVFLIYIAAFFVGFMVFKITSDMHILMSTLLADIAATSVVWASGILFGNSSVYDPYWSVAPPLIMAFWILEKAMALSFIDILFAAAVFVWGIRLTFNWAHRWRGLGHQDWRYTMLRKKSPRLWFFTNLIGINIMPTLIVYVALISVYFGIGTGKELNIFTAAGFFICLGAVLAQVIADRQMDIFRKENPGRESYMDRGLWRYCRHPNYLGEVFFWWGLWLMQIGTAPRIWFTVAGPLLVTLMFVFISIPMMERHILKSRPGYRQYQENVPVIRLLPWKTTKDIQ